MMKILESVLILAWLCSPTSAQTTEACRAAVQHLSLPGGAVTDYDVAPLELLFLKAGRIFISPHPIVVQTLYSGFEITE